MAFDGRAVVEKGGQVVLKGLPYEVGRAVSYRVELVEEEVDLRPPQELSDDEWIARVMRVAKEMGERHPHGPILTDYDMSREAIYADEGP